MYSLQATDLMLVSGGCDDTCKAATITWLQSCSYEDLQQLNHIFKKVVLSDEMKGVDGQTIVNAMIAAVEKL